MMMFKREWRMIAAVEIAKQLVANDVIPQRAAKQAVETVVHLERELNQEFPDDDEIDD